MKKHLNLFAAGIFITFSAFMCESNSPSEIHFDADCFDSSKIKHDAACITLYDPVCGCDKKTYGNSCEAINSGILKFTGGECK
jgi:hypothetical protein